MDKDSTLDLPLPFNIYRRVVTGDHLHFGYWPEHDADLSLEEAQERMLQKLVSFFPEPPARVLDVGCGLGLSAHHLASLGYDVFAIAPSRKLIDYAKKKYDHSRITYHESGFMDVGLETRVGEPFDVLFFQESLQYMAPLGDVFQRARELLLEQGRIVLCDETRQDPDLMTQTAVHLYSDVICSFLERGFRPKQDLDIGSNVHKTCAHMVSRLKELKTREYANSTSASESAWLDHLISGWCSQQAWYASGQFSYHIWMIKKDELFFRPFSNGEEQDILKAFNSVFAQKRSPEHWSWKFEDNPFGKRNIALAWSVTGDLAGHFAGYPVAMSSPERKQEPFLSLQVGDTLTNPEYRRHGLGKTSVLARVASFFFHYFCEHEVPFVYGFNTGNIRKFGERYLGYKYISSVPHHVLGLDSARTPGRSIFQRLLSGYNVQRFLEASPDMDRFYHEAATDYDFLVVRCRHYLDWRYFQCPDKDYGFFGLMRFRRLVGWGVFALQGESLIWGDALFARKHIALLPFFLSEVQKKFAPQAKRIEGWFAPVPAWWKGALAAAGFETLREPNDLAPCFRIFDSSFTAEWMEDNFYYTMGDSDLF